MTAMDLEKFEQFKRKFDPSFGGSKQANSSQQGPSIKWPSNNVQSRAQNDDDDLYS